MYGRLNRICGVLFGGSQHREYVHVKGLVMSRFTTDKGRLSRKAAFWTPIVLLGVFTAVGPIVYSWAFFKKQPQAARGPNYTYVLAMDDVAGANVSWLDEKPASKCDDEDESAVFWEGKYSLKICGSSALLEYPAVAWGQQGKAHAGMQYTMKTTPGKDHLIWIRTWTNPKKGFALQVVDDAMAALMDEGESWKTIDTVWTESTKENEWTDVFLKLPKEYVIDKTTTFRIACPEGSMSGSNKDQPKIASTGAVLIRIMDKTEKPAVGADFATESKLAAELGLPSKGIVGRTTRGMTFEGFDAPYRLMSDKNQAAVIVRRIGDGMYIKMEMDDNFAAENVPQMVDKLLSEKK